MTAETTTGGGLRDQAAAMARTNVWTEEQLVADVEAAPPGPRVGAFFDFDGTVIDGYTAVAVYRDRIRKRDVGLRELGQTRAISAVRTSGASGRGPKTGSA